MVSTLRLIQVPHWPLPLHLLLLLELFFFLFLFLRRGELLELALRQPLGLRGVSRPLHVHELLELLRQPKRRGRARPALALARTRTTLVLLVGLQAPQDVQLLLKLHLGLHVQQVVEVSHGCPTPSAPLRRLSLASAIDRLDRCALPYVCCFSFSFFGGKSTFNVFSGNVVFSASHDRFLWKNWTLGWQGQREVRGGRDTEPREAHGRRPPDSERHATGPIAEPLQAGSQRWDCG